MNIIARPPTGNGQGSPEPYEDLLRGFFRAEMPEPWPELNRPDPRVLPFVRPRRASRFASARSRLALAASVTLLLVGSWFLSGSLRNAPVGTNYIDTSKPGPGTKPIDPTKDKTPPIKKVR